MLVLEPGAVLSSSTTPQQLDTWIIDPATGFLADPYSIEFQLWSMGDVPAQFAPANGWTAATKLATGHYCVEAVLPDETSGLCQVRWRWQLVEGGAYYQIRRDFEVVGALYVDCRGDWLCLPADVYAEGFDATEIPARRMQALISEASDRIRQWTGRRSFEPLAGPLYATGRGSGKLWLDEPIIGLDTIYDVSLLNGAEDLLEFDVQDFLVRNGHLRQGGGAALVDRENPALEYGDDGEWARGARYKVEGVFGFTDPDHGVTSGPGRLPSNIRRAAVLLVVREHVQARYFDESEDRKTRHRLQSERVGSHGMALYPQKEGPVTGDPEIDRLLVEAMRPFDGGVM